MTSNMDTDNKQNLSIGSEKRENVLEPTLSIGFVLMGRTTLIYEVSKAIQAVLDSHKGVKLVFTKSSVGRLWIVEREPDG